MAGRCVRDEAGEKSARGREGGDFTPTLGWGTAIFL